MKGLLCWCALLLVVCSAARAGAQSPEAPALGEVGHVAVSMERLFGFDYDSETRSVNGMEQGKTTATGFSLLSNPLSALFTAFSFPRGAIDVFVAPGFSVGASLGAFYNSQTSTPTGGTATDQSITGFVLMPRIGYAARLSPSVSVWPRGGISIIYASTSISTAGMDAGSGTAHLIAATIEVPLVFTIAPRVALTLGPTFDLSFSGSTTSTPTRGTGTTTDEKITEVGVQAGLLVVL